MSYYTEVYLKRLNRYGLDYQSRLQGQRERNFDDYLLKTLFRVEFTYNNAVHAASLERYKQDSSETQAYLLTKTSLKLPNGTILDIVNQDSTTQKWMIWWLESIESSGYNKYIALKMTHSLTWISGELAVTQWGYFSGPGTSKISDTIKSARSQTLYTENNNLHMFITPYIATLIKDTYFEVSYEGTKQAYIVTELDVNSTPGVMYVSVDPTPVRDAAPAANPTTTKAAEDYWFNGGE